MREPRQAAAVEFGDVMAVALEDHFVSIASSEAFFSVPDNFLTVQSLSTAQEVPMTKTDQREKFFSIGEAGRCSKGLGT